MNLPDAILVALDGSVEAQNAAEIAIQIAHNERMSVKGIFIVDEALVLDTYSDYQHELGRDEGPVSRNELVEMFEAKGAVLLEQLRASCDQMDVKVETDLLFGGVLEVLLERTADNFMLSLGRRGNTHAGGLQYLGDYFLHIAHRARNPIIVGGEISRSVKRLFLVYRGRARAESSVDWIVRLQQSFNTQVVVGFFPNNDQKDYLGDAQQFFSERGLIDYSTVDFRSRSLPEIAATLSKCQADMILMHGYWHSEFFDKLFGSLNDEILLQSQLPVLMV